MNQLLSVHWIIIAAIWYFGNGVLHDVFVLINHKEGYNRELLRLLMDGHVLILSGLVMGACYFAMTGNIRYGALIALIIALAMLVYCLMIFPFLKSFVTMGISVVVIGVCVRFLSVNNLGT